MKKIELGTTASEIGTATLAVAAGQKAEKREPITRAEQEAVLARFGLVNLLDLVVLSAIRASDKMSLTVESTYSGVRVVVRVTHPRVKKGSGLGARGSGEGSGA